MGMAWLAFMLAAAMLGVAEAGEAPPSPQDLVVSFNPLRLNNRVGMQVSVFSQRETSYRVGLLIPVAVSEEGRFKVLVSILEPPMRPEGLLRCGIPGDESLGQGRLWKGTCANVRHRNLAVVVFWIASHTFEELEKLGIKKLTAAVQSNRGEEFFLFRRDVLMERLRTLPEANSDELGSGVNQKDDQI